MVSGCEVWWQVLFRVVKDQQRLIRNVLFINLNENQSIKSQVNRNMSVSRVHNWRRSVVIFVQVNAQQGLIKYTPIGGVFDWWWALLIIGSVEWDWSKYSIEGLIFLWKKSGWVWQFQPTPCILRLCLWISLAKCTLE